jgi:hypothetical protein
MYRSCQRQTHVFDFPVAAMIAWVPKPCAVKKMMRARQTCFCAEPRPPDDRVKPLRIRCGDLYLDTRSHAPSSHDDDGMGIPQTDSFVPINPLA